MAYVQRELHGGAAGDSSSVATAVDIAHDIGMGIVGQERHGVAARCAVGRCADDYSGIGGHGSGATLGATVDATTDAQDFGRTILHGIGMRHMDDIDAGRSGIDLLSADGDFVGSIGRLIAAAIDIGDIELAGALEVEDVDGDEARDVAVDIGAAESIGDGTTIYIKVDVAGDIGRFPGRAFRAAVDRLEGAAVDVEGDVAVDDFGLVGAAVEFVDIIHAASHGEFHVAVGRGLIGAAEERDDVFFLIVVTSAVATRTGLQDGETLDTAKDVTRGVGASESSGEVATLDGGGGVAVDVGRAVGVGIFVPRRCGVGEGMTVAAAEEGVDAATLDGDIDVGLDGVGARHAAYVGSAAAAVDHLDGVFAVVDKDCGGVTVGHRRHVGRLVAAPVDGLDGESGVCVPIRSTGRDSGLERFEVGEGAHQVVGSSGSVGGLPDVDLDVVAGSACDIIAAEDIASDGGAAADVACALFFLSDIDVHAAFDEGFDEWICLTAAAAVDATRHDAGEDIYPGGIGGIGTYVGQVAAAVDVAVDSHLPLR